MWIVKLYDQSGQFIEVNPGIDKTADKFLYFAFCVDVALDRLNGLPRLQPAFEEMGCPALSSEVGASAIFISMLNDHVDFQEEKIFQYIDKLSLSNLLEKDIKDPNYQKYFIKFLMKFKIPGIARMNIRFILLSNEGILSRIKFPEKLIPAKYKCSLTCKVMIKPCVDLAMKNVVLDWTSYARAFEENGKNPYTRAPIDLNELMIQTKLAAQIELFIQKAQWIHSISEGSKPPYEKYQSALFNSELSLEAMQCARSSSQVASSLFSQSINVLYARVQQVPESILALFQTYKMPEVIFPTDADLEKLLRRICSAGNDEHLGQILKLNVDINANHNPQKRTALHWLVIRANEKNPDEQENFKKCYELLLERGVDTEIKDDFANQKRTAAEYDERNLFPSQTAENKSSFSL